MEVAGQDFASGVTVSPLIQRRHEMVTLLALNCHWTLGGFSG
jgi:hypothetical protein